MAEIVVDSFQYVSGTIYNAYSLYATDARTQAFMTFVGKDVTLTKCEWSLLRNNNTRTGYVYAKIYALTGTPGSTGKPTGEALAVSDGIPYNNLTTTQAVYTFNFSGANQITLEDGVDYCVAVEFTAGDGTHSVKPRGVAAADGDAAKNDGYFINNTTWTAGTYDLFFRVYGNESVVVNAEISKVGGIAIASISKYIGIAKAAIKKVNGLTIQ
jgi:hypothetical protein